MSSADNRTYAALENYSLDRDTTLTAKWKVKTYSITFDANGGNPVEGDLINPDKTTKRYGYDYVIPDTVPTRSDYNFIGWSEDPNAAVGTYKPGGLLTQNAAVTLYAIWEGDTYAVEYDANGGVNPPASSGPIIKDRNLTISSTKPTKDGFNFVGWSTNPNGNKRDIEYKPGDTYTGRTSIKLYAIWERGNYTIVYMANGNQFTTQEKTHDVSIEITSLVPTKEEYIFAGWSKTDNSATIDYFTNQTFEENQNITLYAVWTSTLISPYNSVTYDSNGGEGAPETQFIIDNRAVTIPNQKPTREGYTFLGWSTDRNATEANANYNPGKTYIGESITLYAVWRGNPLTLTIDPNGGTWRGSKEIQTLNVVAGQKINIELANQDGYQYITWTTTKGDAKVQAVFDENYSIISNNVIMGIQNSTIKAEKSGNYYDLTYNANSTDSTITGIPDSIIIQYGVEIELSSNVPTRTGYNFAGWASTANATKAEYNSGGKYSLKEPKNTTLYAVWTRKTYTITYDANGGTGAPSSTTKTHGTDLTISTKVPTRSGYEFLGWSTDKNATTATYQPGGKYTANASATLYAVWRKQDIAVTSISLDKTTDQWIQNNYNGVAGKVTITATVSPSNATNKTVTWTSSNPSVATVSGGTVTAKGAGVTTITATAGGKSASVKVYVYNAILGGGYSHYTRDEVGGERTGAIVALTGGAKMILSHASGSYYKIEAYTNGEYDFGTGSYLYIGTESRQYFTNYGAW